MPLEV
jgi:hypothetical protein